MAACLLFKFRRKNLLIRYMWYLISLIPLRWLLFLSCWRNSAHPFSHPAPDRGLNTQKNVIQVAQNKLPDVCQEFQSTSCCHRFVHRGGWRLQVGKSARCRRDCELFLVEQISRTQRPFNSLSSSFVVPLHLVSTLVLLESLKRDNQCFSIWEK